MMSFWVLVYIILLIMSIDYNKIIKEFSWKTKSRNTSIEEIEKFENIIHNNMELPKFYRDFLLKFNGGLSWKKNLFLISKKEWMDGINIYFWLFSKNNINSINYNFINYKWRIPSKLLVIWDDSFWNKICIWIKWEHYGKIYFWDHENEYYKPNDEEEKWVEEYFDNVTKIADSFEEFLKNLMTEEEELEKMKKEDPGRYEDFMKSMEKIEKKKKSFWSRLFEK